MERYHILKLGLAITFYAVYCIRPMLVHSLETDNELDNNQGVSHAELEYFQYFQGVDGKPGIDYPIYSYIPRTSFNCRGIESGYYADLETDCQVFHICEDGKKTSFLCPNGTIFQQSELICEWWNKVNCTNSPHLYEESAERLQSNNARRKSSRRVGSSHGGDARHGAVMRTEEKSSVRAVKNGKDYRVSQQRVNNHRIPDNNEIEQQIEQAESNNRHLADTQNNLQRNSNRNQQRRHPNHNYNTVDDSEQPTKSRQIKKDIDKDTGNYINSNYDQSSSRHSKKIVQGHKNSFDFGDKTGSTLKDYHVQFDSTTATEDNSFQTESQSSNKKPIFESSSPSIKSYQFEGNPGNNFVAINSYSAGSTVAPGNLFQAEAKNQFDYNPGNDFGVVNSHSTGSTVVPGNLFQAEGDKKLETHSGNEFGATNSHSTGSTTVAPGNSLQAEGENFVWRTAKTPCGHGTHSDNSEHKSTASVVEQNISNNKDDIIPTTQPSKPQKYEYGTTIKDKFTSFKARQPGKVNHNTYRGTVKYNSRVKGEQTYDQNTPTTPITTYSPVNRYSTTAAPSGKEQFNNDDNFDLPPFPKHKSELSEPESKRPSIDPISSTVSPTTIPGQIQVNVFQLNPLTAESSSDTSKNNLGDQTDELKFNATQSAEGLTENSSSQKQIDSQDRKQDSGETQIPEESSSFVKSSFNSITDNSFKTSSPYPNHRSTYSDIKELQYLTAPKISAISSITPHLVTTQPINNGKPFVGSQIGSTLLPNQKTTQSKYTYLPTGTTTSSKPTVILGVLRHSSTIAPPPYGPPELVNIDDTPNSENIITDLFNTGRTDKTLPPVETSTPVTYAVPTDIFNTGKTDITIQANVKETTTFPPLRINVPEHGSLNLGQVDASIDNNYEGVEPVNEPPFVKKTVPLLYPDNSNTERTVDHATVYGTYHPSTQRAFVSSKNTPYSPTVPTVTQSSSFASSTARTSNAFNQAVPIKFDKGQDKITVHLSKNVVEHDVTKHGSVLQPPHLKVGAVVHVADVQPVGSSSTTSAPEAKPSGFFVTRGFNAGSTSFATVAPASKTEKPRPFSKSSEYDDVSTGRIKDEVQNTISSVFPLYHISSARPFETTPTTRATTPTPPALNVYDNVDNMIEVLQEIANYNSQKEVGNEARPGLVIPPSVGPQTLHSLVQYFANELQNNDTNNDVLEQETKEKLNNLLTAMTVHGYNNLFNVGSTATSTTGLETTTVSTPFRSGNEERSKDDGESSSTSSEPDNLTGDDGDLLSTTSLPELRQLARNFSLALSSYLNDPDNFRKSLEGLRPTEPPAIDGSDNTESSTTEDELLSFSDADVKRSTPANPSATWGYILATESYKGTQEDVKNSLNPDLNTADSQSFIPRFNNLQVDEKQGKASNDLPPDHWTASPKATKLWQSALSINPAVVNDHLETTTSNGALIDDETTEPELFNPDVLPDLAEPSSEISYELRELPPLALNSTQVHGILIDFMNNTNSAAHNRLNRILKKLNTSEEEFLSRMKEIESNPLTKRLILLLISECGANISQELGFPSSNPPAPIDSKETLPVAASLTASPSKRENHSLGQLVHPHLSEDEQDSRALQLLNSLYTIASRFGKKR